MRLKAIILTKYPNKKLARLAKKAIKRDFRYFIWNKNIIRILSTIKTRSSTTKISMGEYENRLANGHVNKLIRKTYIAIFFHPCPLRNARTIRNSRTKLIKKDAIKTIIAVWISRDISISPIKYEYYG